MKDKPFPTVEELRELKRIATKYMDWRIRRGTIVTDQKAKTHMFHCAAQLGRVITQVDEHLPYWSEK